MCLSGPSYNDLKFTAWNCNYFFINLNISPFSLRLRGEWTQKYLSQGSWKIRTFNWFSSGFYDFWPPDSFLSVSFVVSFIVRNSAGLSVCSKGERHGETRPLSLPSPWHLLCDGQVSLVPLLLGWQIFWKQEWRAQGFTNDSWGDARRGLLS